MIGCEYRGLISIAVKFYNYAKVGEIHQCFWPNKLATFKIVVTSPLIFIVYRTSFLSVAIFILKISKSKSIIKTREGLKDRYNDSCGFLVIISCLSFHMNKFTGFQRLLPT